MKKSETKKFIAVIDPRVVIDSGFIYKALAAKNLLEAMNEASKYTSDDIYLISIFEKLPGGDKEKVQYSRALTNRGSGWRTNEEANEREEVLSFYYKYHDGASAITSVDIDWAY